MVNKKNRGLQYGPGFVLSQGKLLSGLNKAWLNLNGIKELATKADIPSIPSIPSVIDNLTSTLTTAALSANQGRVLKGLIDAASSSSTSGSIECLVNNASLSVTGKNSSSRSVSVSDYKILFVYCPEYSFDGSNSGTPWDSYGYISTNIDGTFYYRIVDKYNAVRNDSYTGPLPTIDSPRAILIFNTNKAIAIELCTNVVTNNRDQTSYLLSGRTGFTSTVSTLTYGVRCTSNSNDANMNNLYIYGIKF